MNIVLTATFDKGIFCNGLQQNIIFLAEMLEKMGYNTIVCLSHTRAESKDCPEDLNVIERHELIGLKDIDYLLQTGWVVDNKIVDAMKSVNPKMQNVHIHYGNRMLADIEQADRDTVSVGNYRVDQAWISPHYELSTNYFKTFLVPVGEPDYYWRDAWDNYVKTGDTTQVKLRLEELVAKMINAAEFQLM